MATYNPMPLAKKRHKLSIRKRNKLANAILHNKELRETAASGAFRNRNWELYVMLTNKKPLSSRYNKIHVRKH